MSEYVQRTYPRKAFEAPIKYAVPNSNQFSHTRTINYSTDGLCFIADQKLEPEAEVCVVMDNYAPGRSGPESYQSYLTRVRWIRPLSAHRPERFIAGTQIMSRSHEILAAHVDESCHFCDLCGERIQECLLHCTDENAQLCEPCYQHYGTLPEGQTRECVARFLVGNVV